MVDERETGSAGPEDDELLDAEGAGENVCPQCSGSGTLDGDTCPTCGGSGKVIEEVGGA